MQTHVIDFPATESRTVYAFPHDRKRLWSYKHRLIDEPPYKQNKLLIFASSVFAKDVVFDVQGKRYISEIAHLLKDIMYSVHCRNQIIQVC